MAGLPSFLAKTQEVSLGFSLNKVLEPIRDKRKHYEENPKEVMDILMAGTDKARVIAKETMEKVKKSMKLDY